MYINGKKFTPKRFSSGELKLIKEELTSFVKNGKVEIMQTKKLSMFETLLIMDYYISNNILVDLIITYLPYQRMDHQTSHEVETVKNVANIINELNLNSVTICEPHCDISYFKNAKEFSYINALKEKVFKEINFNPLIDCIILTDKGGYKRYNGISNNLAYFNKTRDKQTGLIVKHEIVGEYNPNGKALIVDDIISSGDTIINIVDMLSLWGQKDIYILSGHIENNKYNKRVFSHPAVKKVFSTNSLRQKQTKKLKLYKTEELFYGKNWNWKNCKLD